MSRAEAAAIFARLISEQKGEKISGKSDFADVKSNEWYSKFIGYIKNMVSSKAMTITPLSRTKIYPVRNLLL